MGGPATVIPPTSSSAPATIGPPAGPSLKKQWDLTDPAPLASGTNEKAKKFGEDFKGAMEPVKQCLLYTKGNAEKPKHDEMVSKRDAIYNQFPAKQGEINKDEAKADSISKPFLDGARKLAGEANALKSKTEASLKAWQAKEPSYNKSVEEIEELEKWDTKEEYKTLRTSSNEIRTATNENKYDEAVKRLVQLQTNLKPVHDEYKKQKAAKEKYDPALQSLQPRLTKALEPKFKSLSLKRDELAGIQTKMETSAQGKNYVVALEALHQLAPKVDACLVEVDKLTKQKEAYDAVWTRVKPKLPEASVSKFQKLAAAQQEIATTAKAAESAAAEEKFEDALKTANKIEPQLDAFKTKLNELEQQKKAYDDALGRVTPKLPTVEGAKSFKKLAPLHEENEKIKKAMEEAAQKEDFVPAAKSANDLSTKIDTLKKALDEAEQQKKAYEEAKGKVEQKLNQTLQNNRPKLAKQRDEIAATKTQVDAAVEAQDYVKAKQLIETLPAKLDAFTKAVEELDKKKKAYDDALAKLQPKLVGAPLDNESAAVRTQMKTAAAAEDYDQAMKLLADLEAKVKSAASVVYRIGFLDGRTGTATHRNDFKANAELAARYEQGFKDGTRESPAKADGKPKEIRSLSDEEAKAGEEGMKELEERQKAMEELLDLQKEISQENPKHIKLGRGSNNPRVVPPRPMPRAPGR